jgi:protein-S-isoprenylcysteine O-methyltransferase Ste14
MSEGSSDSSAQGKDRGQISKPKLVFQILVYVLFLVVVTFLIAGRWDWWMAWIYFLLYALTMVVAVLAVPMEQQLIEERTSIKDGVKRWDKWLTAPLSWAYPLLLFVLAALEMRFGQKLVFHPWLQIAGLLASVLGQLFSTWAMAVNKFYARFVRIQTDRGHYPITGGPYRFIRHPGYVGVIVGALGAAFAIGSLWTLVFSAVISVLLIVRTALEDRVLQDELEGYASYAQKTRYRLLPGIW